MQPPGISQEFRNERPASLSHDCGPQSPAALPAARATPCSCCCHQNSGWLFSVQRSWMGQRRNKASSLTHERLENKPVPFRCASASFPSALVRVPAGRAPQDRPLSCACGCSPPQVMLPARGSVTLLGCSHLARRLLAGCGKRLGSMWSRAGSLLGHRVEPEVEKPQRIKETVFHVLLLLMDDWC